MSMSQLRKGYHEAICSRILGYRNGVPNIADGSSKRSVELAKIEGKLGIAGDLTIQNLKVLNADADKTGGL